MKRGVMSTILGIALVASAGSAWAGTIGVTVKDPSGAVVRASVKVGKVTASTDASGVAILEDLPGGTHKVEVMVTCYTASGQATAIRRASKEVKVGDEESVALTIQLERCPPDAGRKSEEEDPGEE